MHVHHWLHRLPCLWKLTPANARQSSYGRPQRAVRGQSTEQLKARHPAFLEGMKFGSFILAPGKVPEAAA